MKLLGIEFAPLNVSIERRLQTLAAATWFFTMGLGFLPSFLLTFYFLAYTKYWWLVLLYILWMYLDKDTSERGGRPFKWVQSWTWWRYVRDYFPLHLASVPETTLDPNKNYIFCSFPHGIIPAGAFNAFATNSKEYHQLFPNHTPKLATLSQHFNVPFYRELAFSIGGISCSPKSLDYVLSDNKGGYIIILTPGGAAEAYRSRPGVYKTLLGKRKGFVKLALKHGTPLVPVISFGETDLFDQVDGPRLRRVQEFLRKYIGVAPVVLVGRGFFQYSFGLIPRRREVTTLVGKPIDLPKIENPSKEEIEKYHQRFIYQLKDMFEEHKYKYLKDAENKHLEVED